MKDRKISLRQYLTVLFLGLFALGTERLPVRLASAGSAGWLCPILTGVVLLVLGSLAGRNGGLSQPLTGERKARSRLLAAPILLWGVFLTSAEAVRIGCRLSDSLRASPALLMAGILLLAGWMASGGLPAFARACEIFMLAVGGGFLLIVLGGVFRIRWDYLLLWSTEELQHVPQGMLATGGLAAVGCYGLFLFKDVRLQKATGKPVFRKLSLLMLSLSAAIALVVGRFGPALTGKINRPFFQMVSGLGFEGGFQRLEELASALWVLGDGALLGMLLLSLSRVLTIYVKRGNEGSKVWILTAAVFLAGLPLAFWNGVLEGWLLPVGNLLAGGGILLLARRTGEKKNEEI